MCVTGALRSAGRKLSGLLRSDFSKISRAAKLSSHQGAFTTGLCCLPCDMDAANAAAIISEVAQAAEAATSAYKLGHLAAASEAYDRVVVQYSRRFGDASCSTAFSFVNMCSGLANASRSGAYFLGALPLVERASAALRALPPDTPDLPPLIATRDLHLATVSLVTGMTAIAILAGKSALSRHELLGSSQGVARACIVLGDAYTSAGQFDRALLLQARGLAILRGLRPGSLDEDCCLIAEGEMSAAEAYSGLFRHEDALARCHTALSHAEPLVGPGSKPFADLLSRAGAVMHASGEDSNAIAIVTLTRATEVYESLGLERSLEFSLAAGKLGTAFLASPDQEERDLALLSILSALSILASVLPKAHPAVMTATGQLAALRDRSVSRAAAQVLAASKQWQRQSQTVCAGPG